MTSATVGCAPHLWKRVHAKGPKEFRLTIREHEDQDLRSFGQGPSYSPTALLFRVQQFRKGLNKAVEGISTRHIMSPLDTHWGLLSTSKAFYFKYFR